jgi:hypothetical protein
MAVRLLGAHVQPSKDPERAVIKVCDSGEIQDDGLCALGNQSFHPGSETRCLLTVHESAHANYDSGVRPITDGQPQVHIPSHRERESTPQLNESSTACDFPGITPV